MAHFARLGYPFPKSLLDYRPPSGGIDSRIRMDPLSPRLTDIPSDYLDAGSAHICPMDYLAHTLLPSTFRQGHITTITLDAGPGYMNPTFFDGIPAVLSGLTAFLTNEEKIRNLFQGRTSDLWAMAEELASYGCELIVIKRGDRGQILYDHASHARWIVPAYPARLVDPTGTGDAFCGGFLAGFRTTYLPLEAVLYGNISASFTLEGTGVFYTMDAYPPLAKLRISSLRNLIRKA
ncbi:MAG TPA: carbohydrate kinase family protein [Anaerolineaceae bacterium]|nr:carbohydrate kinase family protein [Anaerolineaceae bacterium]